MAHIYSCFYPGSSTSALTDGGLHNILYGFSSAIFRCAGCQQWQMILKKKYYKDFPACSKRKMLKVLIFHEYFTQKSWFSYWFFHNAN